MGATGLSLGHGPTRIKEATARPDSRAVAIAIHGGHPGWGNSKTAASRAASPFGRAVKPACRRSFRRKADGRLSHALVPPLARDCIVAWNTAIAAATIAAASR